tara:strand:- start:13 stop:606 length:594 start_codon:yes stop_codon:yes gene_type:complete
MSDISFKVLSNVKLGTNVIIEDFCIVGIKSINSKNLQTYIGSDSFIRAGSYIYEGNQIGNNFFAGHKVTMRERNTIGNNVSIGTGCGIEHDCEIYDNVRIHSNILMAPLTVVKKNVWMGPNIVITNSKYPNQVDSKEKMQSAIFEENSIIGGNVTILPGIIIGENSIVGAGSVVTKNVKKNTIVAGNPAKIINKINQ